MLRQLFWRPDVVLVVEPSFLNTFASLLTARLARCKSWLHVQDLELDLAFQSGQLGLGRKLGYFVERWVLRRFDVVSTIASQMQTRLREKGVLKQSLRLLPNWFDPSIVPGTSALRQQLRIREDAIVAMFAGTLGAKQGLEIVVEAARQLRDHSNIVFVVCGNGPESERLRYAAVDLPNIRLLPLQESDRVSDLLNAADIHILPQGAYTAGLVMPSKLLGMLASGRPVVACSSPDTDIAHLVEGCGRVVPLGDIRAFCSAVLELASDPTSRETLGKLARSRAQSNFQRAAILEAWNQVLRELQRPAAEALITAARVS